MRVHPLFRGIGIKEDRVVGPRLELPIETLVLLRVKGAPGGDCRLKGGPGSSLPAELTGFHAWERQNRPDQFGRTGLLKETQS